MSEKLRRHLMEQISKKVETHHLVVWNDPEAQYADFAATVVSKEARFSGWDGSWYELRQAVEDFLGGEKPPKLVVYVPAKPPKEDPLEEIRSAGHEFTLKLRTLIKQTFAGDLSPTRIDEIAKGAETLRDAEFALTGQETSFVRLATKLGSADHIEMAILLLSGEKAIGEDLREDAKEFLSEVFGGVHSSSKGLEESVVRHLLLTEIKDALGGLPSALSKHAADASKEQVQRVLTLLKRWRRDRDRQLSYAQRSAKVEAELKLSSVLTWDPKLQALETTPCLESFAFEEAVRFLEMGELEAAAAVAQERLRGFWATTSLPDPFEGSEVWGPRWAAVSAIADLREAVRKHHPRSGEVDELLTWYVEGGWQVDRAHRNLELSVSALEIEGKLEEPIGLARQEYEDWLDEALKHFATAANRRLDYGRFLRQGEVHDRFVDSANGPVALVIVDAMRFELGMELAEALRPKCSSVEVEPAVAAIPTITPVGMANLSPKASTALSLTLKGQRLQVSIGDVVVKGVPERDQLLQAAHGQIRAMKLNDIVQEGEKALQRKIAGTSLVVVRSQEFDTVGESGMLAVTWPGFQVVAEQLVRAITRLKQAGVTKAVITSDHGFVVLSRGLRPDRVIDSPSGGIGDLHRRGWVGKGAIDPPNTLRVVLADAEINSDLDLIAPASLAVFKTSGERQFFHGGLSPQELVIPVIVARFEESPDPERLEIDVEVAGGKVSTGVFSATLSLVRSTLLTSAREVRAEARRASTGDVVALAVSGDGFDRPTKTVRLEAEGKNVVTLQVVRNLKRGEELDLVVLDSDTDLELATARVPVSNAVVVEESLD
jgi:hypothetical protein